MEIKQLENLSELSKLAFDESEANQMMSDLDKLVEMVSVVKDADVDGTFKIKTIDMEDLRDDEVVESVGPEVMLRNAPEAKKNSFVVPRIME